MAKLSFLVGLGAGYVLGAKAGKERYQQIKKQTAKAWGHPQVQEKVGEVSGQVKNKAPQVAAAAGSAAVKAATQAVRGGGSASSSSGEDLPPSIHRGTDGRLHAESGAFGPGPDALP